MDNQLQELKDFLIQNTFTQKISGFEYVFKNDTIHVNNQPICKYSVFKKDDKYYINQQLGLTTTDPLWLIIKPDISSILTITFFDEIFQKELFTISPSL